MRLRLKFIAIDVLTFVAVLSVVAFSIATEYRLEAIRDTVDAGTALLSQSREVRGLTKDILIGAFAPGTYSELKDVVYLSPYAAAQREWKAAIASFKDRFDIFMKKDALRAMVERGVLGDEYATALIMSRKAFSSLDALEGRVDQLRQRGLLGSRNLYTLIQESSDPELTGLFGEARVTSYYLTNNFESYLHYFIESLEREAELLRRDLLLFFVVVGLGTAVFATTVTLLFSSRIVHRLRRVGEAVRGVSAGDFSTPLDFRTRDEFEDLSKDFNEYTGALKKNVGVMVSLARDVAGTALAMEKESGAGGARPEARVLGAVADAALRDLGAAGAAVLVREGPGARMLAGAGDTAFALGADGEPAAWVAALGDADAPCVVSGGRLMAAPGSVMAGRLGSLDRRWGTLALSSSEHGFNDLDLLRFANFLEFAGLAADNAAQYAQLIELRSAEYRALQSQVRPHFLYNVLSGFAALNRLGRPEDLERSILTLRELLRYSVDHAQDATVKEELDFCGRYCELQGMRFSDRLRWTIDRGNPGPDWRLPKLLLQPLVENAIIHGVEPKGDAGTVRISAEEREAGGQRMLVLEVEDDGVGYDSAASEPGIGLENVRRRLALAHPGSRMEAVSRTGGPTLVRIEIPGAPL